MNAGGALMAAATLALAGCGDSGALRPPEIRLGEDVCVVCGMAVSDGRYAAAVVARLDGRDEVLLLDDIGELPRLALPRHDELGVFVRDEDTQGWLEADRAYFIRSDSLRTPMGFGIAALASEERAAARAAELGGARVPFEELRPGRGAAGAR